jgi:rare lipoprotein A
MNEKGRKFGHAVSLLLGATVLLPGCASQPRHSPQPAAAIHSSRHPEHRGDMAYSRPHRAKGKAYSHTHSSSKSAKGYRARGVASWYGWESGNRTASGARFNPHAFTAAHRTLPLPTRVRVTNLANQRSVVVVVNDRGPFVKGRLIDLSYAAAKALNIRGIGRVEVVALE